MSEIGNVVLEILRHGPPHNQLLSPLTQYLALCGNHSGVTVRVPYEHAQFLNRHQSLNYESSGSDDSPAQHRARHRTELQLQITAQEMAEILAEIPGLIAELTGGQDRQAFTHLEIVLSASELALLPFELANAPDGFPGAGQPMALQSQNPLCITRRVRRVNNDRFCWPDRPRILFAHALPPADAARLVPAHLLALRKAVAPWVGLDPNEPLPPDQPPYTPPNLLGNYLTVLAQASAQRLFAELRKNQYTHVHLLAHGVDLREGVDKRFGLALCDSERPTSTDRVSASRLTTLVRAVVRDCHPRLSLPAVVTLASCNGADGGSIVGAGSSVAHALHEAGVPLVVASQFPLSFQASVLMVQSLYEGLLWGCDPRILLCDLRRQLKLRLPQTHDWASLVAYASLPADLDIRLQKVRFEQAKRAIEAAFSLSDHAALQDCSRRHPTQQPADQEVRNRQKQTLDRLESGKTKLLRLNQEFQEARSRRDRVASEDQALIVGRLASTEKRQAEIEFFSQTERHVESDPWRKTLHKSCRYYRDAFLVDRSQTWALAQDLALTLALDGVSVVFTDGRMRERWELAHQLLELDLEHDDPIRRSWARGNLIEMELVSLWWVELSDGRELGRRNREVAKKAGELAGPLQAGVGPGDWELVSRRRQLSRYVNWLYREPGDGKTAGKQVAAEQKWDRRVRDKIRKLSADLLEQLGGADPELRQAFSLPVDAGAECAKEEAAGATSDDLCHLRGG